MQRKKNSYQNGDLLLLKKINWATSVKNVIVSCINQ